MKKSIKRSLAVVAGIACCSLLFAFAPGGHSFRIYLDDQKMIDQWATSKMDVPTVRLDPAQHHDKLVVQYNECNRTVTGRKLTIKDSKNTILKEWQFDGESTGFGGSMTCQVRDIVALKARGGKLVNLYYSSDDFKTGIQIAYVAIGADEKASLK